MRGSSRAPRFLLCFYLFHSVFASAPIFHVQNTGFLERNVKDGEPLGEYNDDFIPDVGVGAYEDEEHGMWHENGGDDLSFDVDIPDPISSTSACEQNTSKSLIDCRGVKWTNEEYRRVCLARIVENVYCGSNNAVALEPPWLTDFRLFGQPLKEGGVIFGAIYENLRRDTSAPDYIVAFRGTIMCLTKKMILDNRYNCIIAYNNGKSCKRFRHAYEIVEGLTSGKYRVWLTGHSQGASLALNVGQKMMVEGGHSLSTFLFNPPLALPCWLPKCVKSAIGKLPIKCKGMEDQSEKLKEWAPYVYAHQKDYFFCNCFIRYFEQPTRVDKRVMALPSAMLCKNSGKVQGGPHSLEQWTKPNRELQMKCTPYGSAEKYDEEDPRVPSEDWKDIESQVNQSPEAPSQDQLAHPTLATAPILYYYTIPNKKGYHGSPQFPQKKVSLPHNKGKTDVKRDVPCGQ